MTPEEAAEEAAVLFDDWDFHHGGGAVVARLRRDAADASALFDHMRSVGYEPRFLCGGRVSFEPR